MVDVSAILIFRQSYLTPLRSVLQTMDEKAKAVVLDHPGQSGSPATAELTAMFAELLNDANKIFWPRQQDILTQVKESVDQI